MEDDILFFCEGEDANYNQIAEHFGNPKDVAEDFFHAMDAKVVGRFAWNRLRAAYWILTAVLIVSLAGIGVNMYSYVQTRQVLSNAKTGEFCNHRNRMSPFDKSKVNDCTVFIVRTHRKGSDYYWEYHSCVNRFYHTLPPQDSDGSEPYAEDIYVCNNGETTHWRFGEEHTGWYKVFDGDQTQGKENPSCEAQLLNIVRK